MIFISRTFIYSVRGILSILNIVVYRVYCMNQLMNSSEQFETVIMSDFDNSFNCSLVATIFSTLESEIEQAVSEVNAS